MIGVVVFLAICAASTLGYVLAGWDWLSALYQVVITVFGVGFGEVQPIDTPALRIYTMFVIVAGCSAVVYIVGSFIQALTEGEIQRALGIRRQVMEISRLEDHVIICGYGRIGQPLAQHLREAKVPLVVVDDNAMRVQSAREAGFLAHQGNATEDKTLEDVGIKSARTLATVLPDDAANVFITLTAKALNPKVLVIARGETVATEKKLRTAGAQHVILPADIGAVRIAHLITRPSAVELLAAGASRSDLNDQLNQLHLRIDEFPIPLLSPLDGKTLADIETIGQGIFLIIGVRRTDGSIVDNPGKEDRIHVGDRLVIVGHEEDIPKFAARHITPRPMQYRGVRSR